MRPGAYDITSKNYREIQNSLFEKSFNLNKHIFELKSNEKNKLDGLLKKENLNLNSVELVKYILKSIELREYSKFIFSKSIDQIFKLIMKVVPKIKKKKLFHIFQLMKF